MGISMNQGTNNNKGKISQLKEKLAPYTDVLLFVVCLFGANAIWKLSVTGDEDMSNVYLFGHWDITAPFAWLSEHTARVVAWWTSLVRPTIHYYPPYIMRFDSGFGVRIVWSCTPIKQSFIWLMIMLFARGDWHKKLWFVPLGWLCAYVFNIFRITVIGLLCEFHPTMFPLWHEHVFKYLFYAMLFLLWVWWVEKINRQKIATNGLRSGSDDVAFM